MRNNDINDYRRVIHDNLQCIFIDGKFGGDGYLGMSLENLETNILNILTDCKDDVEKFRESISQIFGRPYDKVELDLPEEQV